MYYIIYFLQNQTYYFDKKFSTKNAETVFPISKTALCLLNTTPCFTIFSNGIINLNRLYLFISR